MKALELSAIVLTVASIATGSYYHEWIGVVLSFYTLVFTVVSIRNENDRLASFCFYSSIIVLIGTLIASIMLPYSNVETGSMDLYVWAVLSAVCHAIALPTLSISCLYMIATVSGASYNFALTAGFMPFIGIGMVMPGFILQYMDVLYFGGETMTNAYALYSLLIALAMTAVSAIIVWRIMRKNRYLVTSKGREVKG